MICRSSHVVDLENHLDELGGEHDLLFLRVQRFNHVMLLHIGIARQHTVHPEGRAVFRSLACLQIGQCLDR
uniref:Uncharacterized protein n=1 Tax=Anopheles christyi TaxID=43041 RepID=A0A182KI86_9DIPT